MSERSSARPADLEAYHDETQAIAGYLTSHADELDRALDALRASSHGWMGTVPDASATRAVVTRMRQLAAWVQGVGEAFVAAGGGATAIGATAVVGADERALDRYVGVDPDRPYRLAGRTAPFEESDRSIEDIVRDHLWDGLRSLFPGGDSPVDVVVETLEDVAQELAPELLNQMLSMRAYGRAPDYVVAEADAYSTFFGLGGGAFITYTRSGEIFVAPEAGAGVPGGGVAVRAGWLDQDEMPSGDEVDAFVEGFAVTGSIGVGAYSVAATWNVGTDITDVAYEEGAELGADPASVSISYSVDAGDSGYDWTD